MTMPQHAALALNLRRGGLCAVSPARLCGAGGGVGRRAMEKTSETKDRG